MKEAQSAEAILGFAGLHFGMRAFRVYPLGDGSLGGDSDNSR